MTPLPFAFAQTQDNVLDTNIGLYDSFLIKFLDNDFFIKLFNVTLYQSELSVSSLKESDTIKFIRTFLNDLVSEIKVSGNIPINTKIYLSYIGLLRQILAAKEDITSRLINYDNVDRHFNITDISLSNIIKTVQSIRINSPLEFKTNLEDVLTIIESYNNVKVIRQSLQSLDELRTLSQKPDVAVLNVLKGYKDTILSAYNGLSQLRVLQKQEQTSDYLIFNNKASVDAAITHIREFFSTKYSIYKTGYELLDVNLSGIESSTITIISGPSNHAKSLFMINIIRNMILGNRDQINERDLFILVTLEDDINKLLRRILSIFGNNDAKIIKRLFIKSMEIFKNGNSSQIADMEALLSKVLEDSIIKVTEGACSLLIKHYNEGNFSVETLNQLIDQYKMEGYTVKLVAIDYVDCMSSSTLKNNVSDDYNIQGQIVQELRLASRVHSVPILTITQNTRSAENVMQEMNNSLIGDSLIFKRVYVSRHIIKFCEFGRTLNF